jgi:hypothetical protein
VYALQLIPRFATRFVPLLIVVLSAVVISRAGVYALFWLLWLPRGKDTLFIYSDSPIWREYMINEVLPLLHKRAIVLNWSQRRKWKRWSLATWVTKPILCKSLIIS